MAKVLIDWSSKHQMPIITSTANFLPTSSKLHTYVFMVDHALEHLRVTINRHRLESICKVPIVITRPRWNPRRDARSQL